MSAVPRLPARLPEPGRRRSERAGRLSPWRWLAAWFALWLPLLLPAAVNAGGLTIGELLAAASRHPEVRVSELAVREGELRAEQASAGLYPKLSLFGKAETYNSPTNLRPMPPTEVNVAAGQSIPFSRDIFRYGVSIEAPLYAAKILRLREKMRLLADRGGIANRINLVSRQATVISLESGWQALSELRQAVDGRLASLAATRDSVRMQVDNGRAAEAELMKIDNTVLALRQQQDELAQKGLDLERDIYQFTGLAATAPVAMELAGPLTGEKLIGVALEEAEVAAQKKEVARARAGRYPTLSVYGTLSGNEGEAYNTDTGISRSYNFAGLVLNQPLFDRTVTADEELARIGEEKAEQKLAQTRIELAALEKNLQSRLPVVADSLALAKQSLANSRKLLGVARVAYASGRTTTEEYLRYEAQVLEAQAAIAKARDEQWQIHAKQAVLYGVDLRGVVK